MPRRSDWALSHRDPSRGLLVCGQQTKIITSNVHFWGSRASGCTSAVASFHSQAELRWANVLFFPWKVWEVGGDIFSCYFHASFLVTVGSLEASKSLPTAWCLFRPERWDSIPAGDGGQRVSPPSGSQEDRGRNSSSNLKTDKPRLMTRPTPQGAPLSVPSLSGTFSRTGNSKHTFLNIQNRCPEPKP